MRTRFIVAFPFVALTRSALFAFLGPLPFVLTTATCFAAEAMVHAAAFKEVSASPVFALGNSIRVDVEFRKLVEAYLFIGIFVGKMRTDHG